MIEEQQKDEWIKRLWSIARGDEDVGHYSVREKQDALHIGKVAGVIVKDVRDETGSIRSRVVVPTSLQTKIVTEIHNLSHAGVLATYRAVKQDHWFRGMKEEVKRVVRLCPKCIALRGRPITAEVLAPDERPAALGERWHIDGIAMEPSNGFDHVIAAVDVATKYVILVKSAGETRQAADEVLREIIRRFRPPGQITTDRGRAFFSETFMAACHGLGIQFKPVAVKQPQANGMIERMNRTIEEVATIQCDGDSLKWPELIPEIEYAINTRVSSVTKFAPFELVYGRKPPGPKLHPTA